MLRKLRQKSAAMAAATVAAAAMAAAGALPSFAEGVGATPAPLAALLAARDRALAAAGLDAPPGPAESGPAQADPAQGGAAPPASGAAHAPRVALSDVRLGLMQLALAAGPAGQPEIVAALPAEDAPALYLREGTATLADLAALAEAAGTPGALRHEDGRYLARMPVFVMLGAQLHIGPGETLELATGDGAFLVSFGGLSIDRARLRAVPPAADAPREGFRPFVASVGSASLRVRDSAFSGLGFGAGPAVSGLAVLTDGLYRPATGSAVTGSRFADLGGISAIGAAGIRIADNILSAPRETALWIDASDDAAVLRNLVTGARGDHALRFGGPSRGGAVRDNVFSTGAHAGLRLDDRAEALRLSGNVVEGFRGAAVVLDQGADCLWLSGNLIRDNGGSALRASGTGSLVITGNAILRNGGTGIVLAGGTARSTALVARNAIAGNRSGIRSATPGRLRLAGNDLSRQLPRLVSGDLSQHAVLFLRAMQAGGGADLEIRHVAARSPDVPLSDDAGARAFAACQSGETG